MNKYEVIIYWSEEDQIFIAEAPELPGCSAHGPTQEAALASAQEAIRLWIDTANEFGDPLPKAATKWVERADHDGLIKTTR